MCRSIPSFITWYEFRRSEVRTIIKADCNKNLISNLVFIYQNFTA